MSGTAGNLTIEGAGPGRTVIDACKLGDRALEIMPGASVTVKDLTITNGHAQDGTGGSAGVDEGSEGGAADPGADGGAILNEGDLTLSDTAVTDSDAGNGGTGGAGGPLGGSGGLGGGDGGSGGGIASTGTLTLSDTTISGNSAGNGGAGGVATVGSTANAQSGDGGSGNSGGNGGGGGGIINESGTATINASTITANTSGAGGAGSPGQNSAPSQGNGGSGGSGGSGGNGAGIASAGSLVANASLQATNDTIEGNTAGDGANAGNPGSAASGIFEDGRGGNGGNGGYGGGLVNLLRSSAPLVDLTIAENSGGTGASGGSASGSFPAGANGSDGHGGGIYASSSSPTLQNTILYEKQTGGDCRGTITDGGHNLVFSLSQLGGVVPEPCPPSGFSTGDPKLAALADNGGPTQTMRLAPGSAAIDRVPATGAKCPAADQRGVSRPQPPGGKCDIGAYEFAPPVCLPVAVTTHAGTAVPVTLSCADPAAVTVTYTTATAPSHGALSGVDTAGGKVTYTPASGFSGTDTFTYLATSVNGTATPATVSITVTATGTHGGSGAGSVPAGKVLPVITYARITNRRFRVAPGATAVSARGLPLGSAFEFRLSTPARLRIALSRSLPGRRAGRRCVAPTRALTRAGAKPCTRWLAAGALTRTLERAGADTVAFTGRIGTRALATGAYQASLQATNSVGSSKPATLAFTIVR
ncbi:MAG: choice-of-anchor Q domain-containing protein [Solirubrobacteraceae bacterium]